MLTNAHTNTHTHTANTTIVKLDEKNPKASPERGCNRLIIVPRKSLPRKSGSTQWGFVDLVEGSLHKLGEEELGEKKYETPKSHAERYACGVFVFVFVSALPFSFFTTSLGYERP